MTQEEIKKEIRKIEQYYDYNHNTNDYDVLVNLTEMTNLISNIEKESYNKAVDKTYLKLHRYLVEHMIQMNLSPLEIDEICKYVTD